MIECKVTWWNDYHKWETVIPPENEPSYIILEETEFAEKRSRYYYEKCLRCGKCSRYYFDNGAYWVWKSGKTEWRKEK